MLIAGMDCMGLPHGASTVNVLKDEQVCLGGIVFVMLTDHDVLVTIVITAAE